MGFEWQTTPEQAFGEMGDAYTRRVRQAVYTLALRYAPEIEAWMKTTAPWTDRTGNARQRLRGEVEQLATQTIIHFSHGVSYGIFLELANGGRYAIIGPALDRFAPRIWNDVQNLMGR